MKRVDWEGKPVRKGFDKAEHGHVEGVNATLMNGLSKHLKYIDLQCRDTKVHWTSEMRSIVIRYRQGLMRHARKVAGKQEQLEESYGGVWMPEYAFDLYTMKKNSDAIAKLKDKTPRAEVVIAEQNRFFNRLLRKAEVSATRVHIPSEDNQQYPPFTKQRSCTARQDSQPKPEERKERAKTAPELSSSVEPRMRRPDYKFSRIVQMIDDTINLRGDLAAGTNVTSAMLTQREKSRRARSRWKKTALAYLTGQLGHIPVKMSISHESKRNFLSGALSWHMLMWGMKAVAIYTRTSTDDTSGSSRAEMSPADQFTMLRRREDTMDLARYFPSTQYSQRYHKEGYLRVRKMKQLRLLGANTF